MKKGPIPKDEPFSFNTLGSRAKQISDSGGRISMTLVATILFFVFSLLSSILRHDLFSQKECSDRKTYLTKVDGSAQKPKVDIYSDPISHFGDP